MDQKLFSETLNGLYKLKNTFSFTLLRIFLLIEGENLLMVPHEGRAVTRIISCSGESAQSCIIQTTLRFKSGMYAAYFPCGGAAGKLNTYS